jgi:hypothetical protein
MACLISSTTTWVSARIVLLFHAGVWKAFLPKRADHKVGSARCKGIKGDDCRERQYKPADAVDHGLIGLRRYGCNGVAGGK